MIVDANNTAQPLAKEYDLCICGAGPAGLTLALKEAARNRSVLLLEAGDFENRERSQEVYRGANIGLAYYPCDTTRLRYFGGTSNHWSGWCRPLDASDYKVREHIRYSGWPISQADLDPHTAETRNILDLDGQSAQPGPDYLSLGPRDSSLKQIEFEFSPPTRFGTKYREPVERAENLHCMVNANLVDIVLRDGGDAVDYLKVANYNGQTFQTRAKYYVLCLGAIENARALLNADRQQREGVGNRHGLVGRFFAEHPHFTVGHFLLEHEHPQVQSLIASRTLGRAFYAPTDTLWRGTES